MDSAAVRRLLVAALVLGGGASSSGAQVVPRPFLDLQPGTSPSSTGSSTVLSVAPGLAWQRARGAAWLRASGDLGGGSTTLRELDAQGRSMLLRLGRFDLGTGTRVQFDRTPDGNAYGRLHADLRLGTGSAARGGSVGLGVRAASAPGWRFAAASARVGGWFRALGLSVTGELTAGQLPIVLGSDSIGSPFDPPDTGSFNPFPDSLSPPPTVTPHGSIQRVRTFASEARLAMSTRLAGMDVDGVGGMFFFDRSTSRGYGTVTLTKWITPRMAAIVGGAVRTLDPGAGASRSVALFGVRFSPGRVRRRVVDAPPAATAALSLARRGEDVTIELRAPGAERVEIAGDFSHWNTLALEHTGGDRWSVTLPLRAGVYRMNVRVDEGEWTPPPGATRMVDAYEGTVGVVVVP
jgi:hypothetical protein